MSIKLTKSIFQKKKINKKYFAGTFIRTNTVINNNIYIQIATVNVVFIAIRYTFVVFMSADRSSYI